MPQNKAVRDDSSDANEETGQSPMPLANGPVRGKRFLHAPDEYQTSNGQQQGSVSSKQSRTKHKQGTMTAGPRAGAAVQSQTLPESRDVEPISEAKSLTTFGRQTVGTSEGVGRVNTRQAKTNSGPENQKTLYGEELETSVMEGKKMGIRYGRVRLQSLEGVRSSVSSPGNDYQSQLDRFLAKLMQADERLIGSSAGHRIQVVDCSPRGCKGSWDEHQSHLREAYCTFEADGSMGSAV